MNTWIHLCPGCFLEKGEVSQCPYCGYDESERRTPLVLPHRVILNNQYVVGKVLGKPGGFGITYLGWDIHLNTRVAIKEYLPRDLASRDMDQATIIAHSREDGDMFLFGLQQFLEEARTLAQFDHPNIVRVRSFFEQNGTGYLVMEYIEGINLAEHISLCGGKVTEQTATSIMMHILDGLREVHSKGFLHRDIKPQNIFITSSGRPILLDFGAARLAMGERSRSLSIVLTPGFAPYEQYHRRGEQGPWTDIYSCAATLYFMVTGITPPDAAERVAQDTLQPVNEIVPEISAVFSNIILQGMALDVRQRPQDVFVFFDLLAGKQTIPSNIGSIPNSANAPTIKQQGFASSPTSVEKSLPVQNKRLPLMVAGVSVLALILIGVGLFLGGFFSTNKSNPSPGRSTQITQTTNQTPLPRPTNDGNSVNSAGTEKPSMNGMEAATVNNKQQSPTSVQQTKEQPKQTVTEESAATPADSGAATQQINTKESTSNAAQEKSSKPQQKRSGGSLW